jgi:hypothetical protein
MDGVGPLPPQHSQGFLALGVASRRSMSEERRRERTWAALVAVLLIGALLRLVLAWHQGPGCPLRQGAPVGPQGPGQDGRGRRDHGR